MQEYYFLLSLGAIWTLFAVIQDLRTTEVSNWLNFSLIAFALTFRALYALSTSNLNFFIFGVLGVFFFVIIAYALYYAKAFAGGDAKLLMGYGALLPYVSYLSILVLGFAFLFILFFLGAIYSIGYSLIIILPKNRKQFSRSFRKYAEKYPLIAVATSILFIFSVIATYINSNFLALLFISLLAPIYAYTKSLDSCMLEKVTPDKLMEGDWIPKSYKMGRFTIKKTVHGLTAQDIARIKKANKSIVIKRGIPFTPAFLLSLIVTGYVVLISPALLSKLLQLVSYLFPL